MLTNFESQLERKKLLDQFLRIRKHPKEFLKAVRTLDEVNRDAPIRHFPTDLEYIDWYIEFWMRENLLAVPKTRRMKMSWINIALFLWDAMFHEGRNLAFVSKKEDDSDELVKRATFIYDHLDESILPKELLPRKDVKFNSLAFPEINSRIRGYPSGADQLRQYTFSRILGDECAFWPDAQEMFAGSKPTLEGGGQIVMISSPGPGFFKRIVHDQLDHQGEFDAQAVLAGRKKSPMQGVNVWKNPTNRFFIFELHYSADPAKRTEAWKAEAKAGLPIRDWMREYELHWDSYDGLPVFPDFSRQVHVKKDLKPQFGLPLLRGWDFGLTPSCVVAQLQGRQLVVLREFTSMNMGADRFADLVLPQMEVFFPQWRGKGDWIDFIDPAGQNRDQSNEGSCALTLDSKGLTCIPGAVAFEERRKAIERLLTTADKDGPGMVLDAATCPVLIRGFEGGYRYPDSVLGREPQQLRPLKDEHSHPQDALQYIATGIQSKRRKAAGSALPQIGYSFSRRGA
jgi:hypothetical protein